MSALIAPHTYRCPFWFGKAQHIECFSLWKNKVKSRRRVEEEKEYCMSLASMFSLNINWQVSLHTLYSMLKTWHSYFSVCPCLSHFHFHLPALWLCKLMYLHLAISVCLLVCTWVLSPWPHTHLIVSASSSSSDTQVLGMSSSEMVSVSERQMSTTSSNISSVTCCFTFSLFLSTSGRKQKTDNISEYLIYMYTIPQKDYLLCVI